MSAATQVSHEVVAEAHKNADVAKEKLHEVQDMGTDLKLKSKYAVEGNSVSGKVSEELQKAWHVTK
ncbi:hypothetical protein [Sodalis glossinidius]|uniref:hypothetical protein n=1 Tax=Sodalis glossinidius TaxID=63612 RepID=UPI000054C98E|nr:hypothetical protein pSG1.91 [Sodalis glossinidius]CAI59533.1 hypothetical protein pSG1.91 [Sodalis glossinidius]